MKKKIVACFAVTLLASACSMLSPVKTQPTVTYVLKAMPAVPVRPSARPVTLLVTKPDTVSFYDTDMMAYSLHPYQVDYYANHGWIATPGQMLQPLILQTLQNTHHFHAVIPASTFGRYNYVLNTQLLQLQQDFAHNPSVIRLKMRAEIVNAATSQVVATKQFNIVTPAPANNACGGAVAANRATAILLAKLAKFCIQKI